MWSWLEKLIAYFRNPDPPRPAPNGPVCPYCGSRNFIEGPAAGISTNICCANSNCRHWFNYNADIIPMEDLNKVEPIPGLHERAGRL